MKPTLTFISTLLLVGVLFLPPTFAQDYMRWELPEGAKMRLGKSEIENREGHVTGIGRARSYYCLMPQRVGTHVTSNPDHY